ncbi:MAG TPA: methylated-DNA--[protein]-cysteine S-methyltransferase [Pirellulales bacterium]|nr:methylated-DNA--[protein]-cysteine S-methyltransferase [Pirellulales bacterium]
MPGTFAPPNTSGTATLVFETELGWMALRSSERGIQRLTFAHGTPDQAARAVANYPCDSRIVEPDDDTLAARLRAYAAGQEDDFLDVALDLPSSLSEFALRVTNRCRRIAWGSTMSYGELASSVRAPGAARAVGSVMARNPVPILVPCHRVLGASGRLGGYSMGSGLPVKRRLLSLERVAGWQ